jgi:uncharacterized membrane protein YphA (DoxX/SURF4 family)
MKVMTVLARFVLGSMFLVFGLNKFFSFLPIPPPEGYALEFMGALAGAGYFFPLLAIFEVTAGLLLLAGRFVPLALTLLAPVVLNIFAFHVFLAPSGLPLAVTLVLLEASLAWAYRDAFRELLRSDVAPTRQERLTGDHGRAHHREARAH